MPQDSQVSVIHVMLRALIYAIYGTPPSLPSPLPSPPSIPHPCNLLSELSPSDADAMADHPLDEPSSSHPEGEATSVPGPQFVKPVQVSATLIPSGLGVTDWSSFGQCLCLDWLPGDGHSRIAAGYSNGN